MMRLYLYIECFDGIHPYALCIQVNRRPFDRMISIFTQMKNDALHQNTLGDTLYRSNIQDSTEWKGDSTNDSTEWAPYSVEWYMKLSKKFSHARRIRPNCYLYKVEWTHIRPNIPLFGRMRLLSVLCYEDSYSEINSLSSF